MSLGKTTKYHVLAYIVFNITYGLKTLPVILILIIPSDICFNFLNETRDDVIKAETKPIVELMSLTTEHQTMKRISKKRSIFHL